MKIGLLINKIDTSGGIQKNYKLLYELFKSKGIETYLFVLYQPKLTTIHDQNIIFLKGLCKVDKGLYLNYKLKQLGPFDLFLVNAEYMKKYLPFQDYYITVHNTWRIKRGGYKGWRAKRKLVSKYKDEKLIGISNSVLDNITDNLHIPVQSKTTIYAPHDFKNVHTLADKTFTIPYEYIVAVGGLSKRKNYPLLINSFVKIAKKHPNLHLVIIGTGSEHENLIHLVQTLGLTEKVHFTGFKENPYPYIKNATLLVSSSLSEGLPRVLVEALSLNTPIVSTLSSDGIYEIMQGKLERYIVPKEDQTTLENTILKALEDYPSLDKNDYEKFDIDRIFEKYIQLTFPPSK